MSPGEAHLRKYMCRMYRRNRTSGCPGCKATAPLSEYPNKRLDSIWNVHKTCLCFGIQVRTTWQSHRRVDRLKGQMAQPSLKMGLRRIEDARVVYAREEHHVIPATPCQFQSRSEQGRSRSMPACLFRASIALTPWHSFPCNIFKGLSRGYSPKLALVTVPGRGGGGGGMGRVSPYRQNG